MVLFIAVPQFLIIFDLNCFFIIGRNSAVSLELILNSLNSLISFEPKADNVAAPSAVASCSLAYIIFVQQISERFCKNH